LLVLDEKDHASQTQLSSIGSLFGGEDQMAGTVFDVLVLCVLFAAAAVCVFVPLGCLAIMFWHWHNELNEVIRLRQARSTPIR
jgi:hypothetical protein